MALDRTALFYTILSLTLLTPPLVRDVQADDFTVLNINDIGAGSLRWAIGQANANPGPDSILFNIPLFTCGGPYCTISPSSALPALTDDETTIDGYSQPGSSFAGGSTPAVLMIELNGTSAGAANGLYIQSAYNLIRGLIINRFVANGIAIGPGTATENHIEGNHIGTNFNGTLDRGNGMDGIFIGQGANGNTIGYYCDGMMCFDGICERNIISGNDWDGIGIHGVGTNGNIIGYNYIGLDANGNNVLGNTLHGIHIYGGAQGNSIDSGNLISGNSQDGVHIAGDNTAGNRIVGSLLGTNTTITVDLGNGGSGVNISSGAHDNIVFINAIMGNTANGVALCGAGTDQNIIANNYIGTGPGSVALGNSENGVYICDGAANNHVGYCDGDRCYGNFISNNTTGVLITGADTAGNVIINNYIGTDTSGLIAQGNTVNGVEIFDGSHSNIIGSENPLQKNVISGNGGDGIFLSGTADNEIKGNYIGADKDATAIISNGGNGIKIDFGSSENIIDSGNVIVGSGEHGISIIAGSEENVISGNFIGTNGDGLDLGNTGNGVNIQSTAAIVDNTVGPSNTITYNSNGVRVDGASVTRHRITENSIYNNDASGILLENGANDNIVAPVITYNTLNQVIGSACAGCTVEVFANSSNDGEGELYLGSVAADGSGRYSLSISSLPYPYLTATATDLTRGTSEFSAIYEARMSFPWIMFIQAITGGGLE